MKWNRIMEIQPIPIDELKQFDQTTEKEYLSLDELCQQIPYRPQTIRNLMSQGILLKGVHYFKPTSRRVVFKWAAIKNWVECKDRKEAIVIPLTRGG